MSSHVTEVEQSILTSDLLRKAFPERKGGIPVPDPRVTWAELKKALSDGTGIHWYGKTPEEAVALRVAWKALAGDKAGSIAEAQRGAMQDAGERLLEEVFTPGSGANRQNIEAAQGPRARLTFGDALVLLKAGHRVARQGWNGKGMFVFLIRDWTYTDGKQDNYPNRPFIAMKTADGNVVPWLASQTDMLAEDWEVVA